mgnify:CR=1 FL=1
MHSAQEPKSYKHANLPWTWSTIANKEVPKKQLILKQFGDCAYGVNLTDNYKGWVVLSDLGKLPEFNFIVFNIGAVLYDNTGL